MKKYFIKFLNPSEALRMGPVFISQGLTFLGAINGIKEEPIKIPIIKCPHACVVPITFTSIINGALVTFYYISIGPS